MKQFIKRLRVEIIDMDTDVARDAQRSDVRNQKSEIRSRRAAEKKLNSIKSGMQEQ